MSPCDISLSIGKACRFSRKLCTSTSNALQQQILQWKSANKIKLIYLEYHSDHIILTKKKQFVTASSSFLCCMLHLRFLFSSVSVVLVADCPLSNFWVTNNLGCSCLWLCLKISTLKAFDELMFLGGSNGVVLVSSKYQEEDKITRFCRQMDGEAWDEHAIRVNGWLYVVFLIPINNGRIICLAEESNCR